MIGVNKQRSNMITKLVTEVKNDSNKKNKKITTIDPILRICKIMYPYLSNRDLLEYSQTALRIILNEQEAVSFQTTLLVHM